MADALRPSACESRKMVSSPATARFLSSFEITAYETPESSDSIPMFMSSRHLTQGAYDLDGLAWDAATNRLSGRSKCVADKPYRLTLLLPETYKLASIACRKKASQAQDGRVLRINLTPARNGTLDWNMVFNRAAIAKSVD